MRTLLLLSTMLLALAATDCLAQARGEARNEATQASPAEDAVAPKSAFGRVMAVLIAKLVQDSTQAAQPRTTAHPRTNAPGGTTLPIDVEVGAAFQPAGSAPTITNTETIPASSAAMPEAEPPARVSELALQAAPAVAGQ